MGIPAGAAHRIRFGEYELDPLTRELRTNGHAVSLQEQPFQILLALIEHPGELVTREELTNRLWPSGTFVDFEHSLNTAVNRLRGALEDSAEHPRFIESLPRRGYRFISQVTIDQSPKLPPPIEPPFEPVKPGDSPVFAQEQTVAAPIHQWHGTHRWLKIVLPMTLALLVAGMAGVTLLRSRRVPQAEIRRSLVLADFSNTTGDPVFEDTLRQGLAVQLEQSPFLDIVSDGQVAQVLSLMSQPRDSKVNAQLADQICRRNGSLAWVDGSVANVDSEYVLALRAVNCQTSQTLAQVQVTARDKKEVLRALGSASTRLRTKLGESLASMQKFDTPLDQATTPSLEALQAYSLGRKAMWKTEDANAVLLFQRAIQLDPNFAMAYSSLGMTYINLGQTILGADNSKKAYDLRAHVSDREKFYIESHYLENVSGNLEKARDVYELWAQTYPNDLVPRTNLGGIYFALGQCDRSLAWDLEGFRVDPGSASGYADRAEDYICLNRLDDAQATVKQALANDLDSPRLRTTMYVLAFARNDAATMVEQVNWGAGRPGVEEILLALEAQTAAFNGNLARARTLSRQAAFLALSEGQKETAALYEVFSALTESRIGDRVEVRRHVEAGLKLSGGRDVQAVAALALAFAGETARSQNLARKLDKNYPEDTFVQSSYLPAINGQLELNGGEYRKALATLQPTAPYEIGNLDGRITAALYPVYVRGQAYLAAQDGHQAEHEFQKILDHPGIVQNKLVGPLSRLGLARAYKLQGDTTKARATYQGFLTIWKDADPDLPILKQAKSEYDNLN